MNNTPPQPPPQIHPGNGWQGGLSTLSPHDNPTIYGQAMPPSPVAPPRPTQPAQPVMPQQPIAPIEPITTPVTQAQLYATGQRTHHGMRSVVAGMIIILMIMIIFLVAGYFLFRKPA